MTTTTREHLFATEAQAQAARRDLINRGAAVSLIAYDPARDRYAFDAGAIHPRTCYHPRSCFLCDRLGYGCGAHRVGDPGHADCTGEASPAEAIALAYGLDQ